MVEFDASTRTAQDAANAISCTGGQIVKSFIFVTQQTRCGMLVMFKLAPADLQTLAQGRVLAVKA